MDFGIIFVGIYTLRLLISILSLFLISTGASGQSFEGKWLVEKKDAYVVIYKKGNQYFGKVYKIGGYKKQKLDIKNPNKALRKRNVQGLEFLTNFTLQDKELVGGKLYDSRSGKTYKGKMWLEKGKLKLRGYLGIFYETRTWTRVK